MATASTHTQVSRFKPVLFILGGSAVVLVGVMLYLLPGFWTSPGHATVLVPALLQIYLPTLVAAMVGLSGLVILLIGVIAAGVRLGLRSTH